MNVMQQYEVRRQVLDLAHNAALIAKQMPSRTGGYLISVDALMATFGRRRLTQKLLADLIVRVRNLCGTALSQLSYDQVNGDLHIDFNNQLSVDQGFLWLGPRAYRIKDWS